LLRLVAPFPYVKPSVLLLTASLLANAALVGLFLSRPAAPAATSRPEHPRGASGDKPDDQAWRAALASGDLAALRAAGVPDNVARELTIGRALARAATRLRTAQAAAASDGRWWRGRANAGSREQQLNARRELADALVAAVGDDFGLAGGDANQLAFLSPAKRDALRRIIQDYDEMMAKFGAGGPQLASDKEKLRLLRAERDRDIAALLTPDERLAYAMRTSPSAATVRSRYGDAIETEGEFQKVFALQKAFDEKYPREALTGRIAPEVLRTRSDAERQLESDLRAAVGEERYAALRRAADPDLRGVDALVSRLSLPPATTDSVAATREAFAAESQRISTNAAVSLPERRAQIQELAGKARGELTRALGPEAADAYAQSSPWINMLQSGTAYATTPQPGLAVIGGNQSVYPVMPGGAGGAGAVRQVFFSGTPAAEGSGTGDRVFNSNVQVMSVTAHDAAPAPAKSDGATGSAAPVTPPPNP
jgi:hypothetical protein